MIRKLNFKSFKFSGRFTAFAAAFAVFLVISSSVGAAGRCQVVYGHYVEHQVTDNCNSLCIEGEYFGAVRGAFSGAVTQLYPPEGAIVTLFTSQSVIHANVAGKSGDLQIKNSGAVHFGGEGDIVDLQLITGGTGDFVGATGAIRASGTFLNGSGDSNYEGTVCMP
ncbi:MAG: hypothetical protein U0350_11210 [Caldilineaceae bacterium]